MTIAEKIISEYLSKGVHLSDVPEELRDQLNAEGWEKVLDYINERAATRLKAHQDEIEAREQQEQARAAEAARRVDNQKSGGNRVKAKQTLNQQWRAYLEKVNNTTAQIEATNNNTHLSVLGISDKVDELRKEFRAITLIDGQKMRHLTLYAHETLNRLYNSRAAQAPADMAPEQYQRQLLDTLDLVERTKDFISKPEYDSAVAMFRNDPLAVKAFNKIFSPGQSEDMASPLANFVLPNPVNRADELRQLASDLDKLLMFSDGRYITDGSFNDDASFIHAAINMQMESIPEVEMDYTPPDPATLTRYQDMVDAVAQMEQILDLAKITNSDVRNAYLSLRDK